MQKIVMVVDDEELVLKASLRQLQRAFPVAEHDYALLAFDNATSALLSARANPEAVYFVITDGHMHGMNGIDFVRLLMQDLGTQVRGCYFCTNDAEFAEEAAATFSALALRATAVYGKAAMAKEWPEILESIRAFLAD